MSDIVLDLAERGQSLASHDRERLVELLLKSLVDTKAPDVDAAWNQEISLRVGAYQRGETHTFAVQDVLAQAERLAP
jgi:Putative addiction module component